MRKIFCGLIASVCLASFGAVAAVSPPIPANIAAAIADSGRPADDKARDDARKPAELLAFAGVKPGDQIADFIPGGGYFTRIFSKAVGSNGKVYAIIPDGLAKAFPKSVDMMKQLTADPAYGNVTMMIEPIEQTGAPQPLDMVWTSQNYHDLYGQDGADGAAAADKAIFKALKPGGVYMIIDHAGAPGTDGTEAATLHRIERATVEQQVKQAGFVLEADSQLLANPADTHTLKVFDPSIRGHTDQFVLKFRKPKS